MHVTCNDVLRSTRWCGLVWGGWGEAAINIITLFLRVFFTDRQTSIAFFLQFKKNLSFHYTDCNYINRHPSFLHLSRQ